MYNKIYLIVFLLLTSVVNIYAQKVKGRVYDNNGEPLPAATVIIEGTQISTLTDENGKFRFRHSPNGKIKITASYIGFESSTQELLIESRDGAMVQFDLKPSTTLTEVEVFGERFKQPEKLDIITRMPLRPSEQIQSISVISDKMIVEQGALTITDAVRNVPGVTLFGSYGGVKESLSTRGYRGVPILKNGVRVDSDFRTASLASDMQGVESIQVIKGSAAVTQGIGDDLGSPGGVINVVTKTPKFVNGGEVGLRIGSWGQVRPTFDVQSILDKNRTVAFRLNGAYERADSYRDGISKNRVYINPSLEWRPDTKTVVTLEMDYLNDNTTPDRGTVNLNGDSIEALYDMGSKFLGFNTDNAETKTLSYAARITRQIADKVSVRAAYFASSNNTDNTGVGALKTIKGQDLNIRSRSLTRSQREDKNYTFLLDLIGRDIYTGPIKHTFQVGFDYKANDLSTTSYGAIAVDTIDIYKEIPNTLPTSVANKSMLAADPVKSSSSAYGLMLQEVMTINQYVKAILGLRYSYGTSSSETSTGKTTGDAWNPMFGIMVSPLKNVNLFGSYTTTTNLRSASNRQEDGSAIGASTTKQWEFGVKSDWLNNRLRFNFTYFHIINENLAYSILDENGVSTPYYGLAGDLKRQGVEVELSGRILPNLQAVLGYAYLDAQYQESPVYVEGSAPMNAPNHTANGWLYYSVDRGLLKGLSIGAGVYYVGERPVNEYLTKRTNANIHDTPPGVKPFDMPAYTTVNAQLAYAIGRVTTRVYFNNIFDEIGYNSYYRGGYINPIDPRNFAATVSYRFW
ncbi:TonB-dependent receptor [Dysgonomonas sp. OttesenSCG-928-M03]|nr:TonB-dependent receptor [Dysgonomonas sp. OttesenSCG-928-M03]